MAITNAFRPVLDFEKYCTNRKNLEVKPRKNFTVEFGRKDNENFVVATLKEESQKHFRESCKSLRYPYIVPGATYNQLWDWDGYFSGLAVYQVNEKHFRGSILNFLDHYQEENGFAHLITPENGPSFSSTALPVFSQWCANAAALSGDYEWIRPHWEKLKAGRTWYEQFCGARHGLFRLNHWPGTGLDNDPVLYGRRNHCVGAVHVNCYHYIEYKAMAIIAHKLGFPEDASNFSRRAELLKQNINTYMWDPIDGMYYHLDLSDLSEDIRNQEVTWEIPYKIRSWGCLFPLWAGVADREKARRLIQEHILNPDEFLSRFGIRSLAANERIYNNLPMGNPSNWQGPVWGASTFITAYGLARYGFRSEATDIASRLIDTFAADLQKNGVLHEYYHAETGAPVIKPGFMSWNLLAVRILDDIRRGFDPAKLPE